MSKEDEKKKSMCHECTYVPPTEQRNMWNVPCLRRENEEKRIEKRYKSNDDSKLDDLRV